MTYHEDPCPRFKQIGKKRIPDGWKYLPIKTFAVVRSGATPLRARATLYYRNGTIPWVKTGDLNNGQINNAEERLTEQALSDTSCQVLPIDTVLIAMYGGFRQIGRTGLLKIPAATNQAISAILQREQFVIPDYLQAWLNFRLPYWKRIAASSRKDPNITKQDIENVPVLIPPKKEQASILNFLSTWDRAIEQAERLIAAKRRRKQALMQQLLTGKRRFKNEHDNKWREARLGDLFVERDETGRVDLPLASITADRGVIFRDELAKKDTSSEDKRLYKRIAPGDIGYNTMRMWQGVSALSSLEGIVSPAYTICVPQAGILPRFAAYLFKYSPMIHLFHRHSQGLVDDTLNLKFSNFAKIRVTFPPVREQLAISECFAICDKEIDGLKQKLDAIKKQKKGLMQQLLTGRVRVSCCKGES